MKKIFISCLILMLSISAFPQSDDMKDLYQQFTGKELDLDSELKGYKDNGVEDSQKNLLDNDSTLAIRLKFKEKLDSLYEAESTYFENYVNGNIVDPYKSKLKQFRIDFSNIMPSNNFNKRVPENYMLTPGDMIILDVWGTINKNYELEFNNEGYIIIPDIGKIDLNGLNYKNVKEVISKKLSSINGLKFAVRIGEVKPIQVFVVGNVLKPGIYNISPFSNILEVISNAGGILPEGSYRNIELKYFDGKKENIDLYSLLFLGKNKELVLTQNSTIFIPLIEKQIAISGNVKKEGIYEYKRNEKLSELLKFSGLTPFSDKERIEIERLSDDGRGTILSASLNDNPKLLDGDIVRIFSTLVFDKQYISLEGNFRHNKKIQFKENMMLSEILDSKERLKNETNMNYGKITRKGIDGKRKFIINFSPKDVFDNKEDGNIVLNNRDVVTVFAMDSVISDNYVEIKGLVKDPNLYNYEKNMTVKDLIIYAGGYQNGAELERIEVVSVINRENKVISSKFYSNTELTKIKLKENDIVIVRKIANFENFKTIKIYGEINYPGEYVVNSNEKFNDLLKRCGGFTDNSSLKATRFFRQSVKKRQDEKLHDLTARLKMIAASRDVDELDLIMESLKLDSMTSTGRFVVDLEDTGKHVDFILQNEDSIFVPSFNNTVYVMGEVFQELAYNFNEKNTKVSFYLNKAGGSTDFADDSNIHIIRANGEIVRNDSWFSSVLSYDLEPGDMIFVPIDYSIFTNISMTKDVATILYQMSVSTAALYNAFKD